MRYAFWDFGSTSVKCDIFDENENRYLSSGRYDFPSATVENGEAYEVAPEKINAVIDALTENAVAKQCDKVLISVQMHGYLMKQEGCFTNYISWRDRTGEPYGKCFDGIDFDLRGTSLKKNLPLTKMNRYHGECELFTLGSYIVYRLCGRNFTHITDAAASGFYNVATARREDALYENIKLPTATLCVETVGICKGMSILSPVGDHQMSFYGSYADGDAYLLNIGTASQLSVLGKAGEHYDGVEARPYFCKDIRLYTKTNLPGGKELKAGIDSESLYAAYQAALDQLPKKGRIVVGGGACAFYKATVAEALKKTGMAYTFTDEYITGKGLERMVKETEVQIGTMLSEIAFTNFPIILKNAGLDFFILDNEHGAFDYSVIASLATKTRLVGSKMIVRLSDNSRMNITKFCDMGVDGFLLPMTNTAEDIQKLVEYAMYAPIGRRGVSMTRAHTMYAPPKLTEYMKTANQKMEIYAQIETASGMENLAEILGVEGVCGVIIGPNDLSCDLNCIGNQEKIRECIKTIVKTSREAGKRAGIITTDASYIQTALEAGADLISYGSELNMIADSCKKIKNKVIGEPYGE